MKKLASLLMALILTFSLAACSSSAGKDPTPTPTAANTTPDTTAPAADPTEPAGTPSVENTEHFVMAYPETMAAMGFTEPLELDYIPERIACMVTSPVFALHEMGVPIIAAPTSTATAYPDDLDATLIGSVAHEDFDIEIVVALDPDLVILSTSYADSHGATLTSLGIPVYYMSAGHTVSYDSVKAETQCLVDAFSLDEQTTARGREMMARFEALESRLDEVRPLYAGKTVMVLQSGSTTMHYIQTARGTLASMADMMGFTNVYENADASMAQIDLEQALEYDPDLILCVGASVDAAGHQELMEEAYALNPDYWYSIGAVERGDVLYLPINYIATSGILVIDEINGLIDLIAEHYAQD